MTTWSIASTTQLGCPVLSRLQKGCRDTDTTTAERLAAGISNPPDLDHLASVRVSFHSQALNPPNTRNATTLDHSGMM